MSTFEQYRQTQLNMVYMTAHLMRLYQRPGYSESTPEEREVYDLIHHRFSETLHITQTRLDGIGQAMPGLITRPAGRPRTLAQIHRETDMGKKKRYPTPVRVRRARQAFRSPESGNSPFQEFSSSLH